VVPPKLAPYLDRVCQLAVYGTEKTVEISEAEGDETRDGDGVLDTEGQGDPMNEESPHNHPV